MELQPFIDCLPILAAMGGSVAIGLLQMARKHRSTHVATRHKIETVKLIKPKV